MGKRVCIIGAGIAGLVTSKTMRADGLDVTVYEHDAEIGGVWASTRTYPGLKANNSKLSFGFSDFDYPEDCPLVPRAEHVRAFLNSYADHFDLRPMIRLEHEVMSAKRRDGQWHVTTNHKGQENTETFDFLAVCNGVFHDAHIPDLTGRESFQGRVLHSNEVTAESYGPEDKVVVVGAAKSAMDCAAEAARRGVHPTMLYRKAHWMLPRSGPDGRPGELLLFTRAMGSTMDYHTNRDAAWFFKSLGKPLLSWWWAMNKKKWIEALDYPEEFIPQNDPPKGMEKIGIGGEFFKLLKDGKASAVKGQPSGFSATGLELANGGSLDADVIIFATGWRQTFPFLEQELLDAISPDGWSRLYRHILPPVEPSLGFIGHAASYANQFTAELSAHWLSEVFLGGVDLPSEADMQTHVDHVHTWSDRLYPNRGPEHFIGGFVVHHVLDLIEDMGCLVNRMSNAKEDIWSPFLPRRFEGLSDERRALHRSA